MIQINYTETMRKVQLINELSERLGQLGTNMNNMINETNVHWRGEAANAYLNQCVVLRQEMADTQQSMLLIAETIKNVAETIKNTDENLAMMASSIGG